MLGAGFGGLEVTTLLSEAMGDDVDVTLIDKADAFVFGFSKLDVMFGRTTPDAIRLPYIDFIKPGVRFCRETITAIDPEALLLFSTAVARHDARLFDEILDWLQLNGAWINLQRLARLQREHRLGNDSVLAAIATQLTRGSSHPKWRMVARRAQKASGDAPLRPLFPHL